MTTIDTVARITRDNAAERLATAAYDQLLALLEELSVEEWERPTECPGWTVADMVGHLIGSAKSYASVREQVRQQVWGFRHRQEFDGNAMDAYNALQVEDHRALPPAERVAALRAVAGPAVRGRMRIPSALRRISGPVAPGGSTAAGMPARETLGHLVDVVITRDGARRRHLRPGRRGRSTRAGRGGVLPGALRAGRRGRLARVAGAVLRPRDRRPQPWALPTPRRAARPRALRGA